jgi:cellulose synthase/poly-beta-1,6-N-acetylglucosamine synthase-like glycosyltransferase
VILLILFWGAVALLLYTYVLFPLIVFVRGILLRQPYQTADITPNVSVVIAAYNEQADIGAKLENILSLDYPRDKLEIIVASDGSDDDTNQIVTNFADQGVKLLALPRQGKADALNAGVATATGDILVFSDANSIFSKNALRALVAPFADPTVGGVAGNQRYAPKTATMTNNEGEQSYWDFDRKLKVSQSQAGNAISATGAIYAIRRSLFRTVPPGVTDDFVTSTSVIAQGYRLVFAPQAVAFEPVAGASDREFGRKVRIMTRGLRAVLVMRELLNPFRYGFYALQLFSHKVLRRLMFAPLIVLLVVNPFLWNQGLFYQVTMLLQIAFYGCALLGWRLANTKLGNLKLFSIPYYFCMVYVAALIATLNIVRGRRIDRWQPQHQNVKVASW